jgi:capsule polysaccharide modification protein KpsS
MPQPDLPLSFGYFLNGWQISYALGKSYNNNVKKFVSSVVMFLFHGDFIVSPLEARTQKRIRVHTAMEFVKNDD